MEDVQDVTNVRRRRLIGAAALIAGMAVAHPTQRVAATSTDTNYIAESGGGTGFRCNTGLYQFGGVLKGTVAGVLGQSYTVNTDPAGAGVRGESTSGAGVYGQSDSYYGVYGKSFGTRGAGYDAGVLGVADVNNANAIAVQGNVTGSAGIGVLGGRRNTGGAFNGVGVKGFSDGGYGVQGDAATGRGVFGSSDSGVGVYGASPTGVGTYGISDSGFGVQAASSNYAVVANLTGTSRSGTAAVYGGANGAGTYGVLGSGLSAAAGVLGKSSGSGYGVLGTNTTGIGVYGVSGGGSSPFGVVGSVSSAPGFALYGIASVNGTVGFAAGASVAGAIAGQFSGPVNIYNSVGANGNLVVQGTVTSSGGYRSATRGADGATRLLYGMDTTEAWVEDFGTGTITGGKADVKLDPDFAALVDTSTLHVFPVSHDASHALHVAGTNATGFSVGVNPSAVGVTAGKKATDLSGSFTYRVVAKRKDVQAERLAKFSMPQEIKLAAPPIPPTPPEPPKMPAPPAPPKG